jgi:hypothetical protein
MSAHQNPPRLGIFVNLTQGVSELPNELLNISIKTDIFIFIFISWLSQEHLIK